MTTVSKAGPLFRVLLVDRAWPDASIEREILAAAGADVIEAPDAAEATLIRLAADVDAMGTCWRRVTEAVIATPHAAFLSEESLRALRSRAARQIVDALEGRTPEHVVRPT